MQAVFAPVYDGRQKTIPPPNHKRFQITMKICGIICEYNPFHNGHAYLLEKAKRESGCDAVICVMSGNFTQRGEPALFDKYTRARHAVLAGADAVLELPTPFAVSPAEIFAKGAVKILNAIPAFDSLIFGGENDDPQFFLDAAKQTSEESREFKTALRAKLKEGISFTKARNEALAETGKEQIARSLRSPNNILGVEYQRALLAFGSDAKIIPVLRTGAEHTDTQMRKNFSSASAIRQAVRDGKLRPIKQNVPPFVYKDIRERNSAENFQRFAHLTALTKSAEYFKNIIDCTEGLENRIKAFAKGAADYGELIGKATTKRYISSRIRRILASAVLDITADLVRKGLRAPLYLKILALKKSRAEDMLAALAQADFPLIVRKNDLSRLSKTAAEVYAKDLLASDVYRICTGKTAERQRLPLVDG